MRAYVVSIGPENVLGPFRAITMFRALDKGLKFAPSKGRKQDLRENHMCPWPIAMQEGHALIAPTHFT